MAILGWVVPTACSPSLKSFSSSFSSPRLPTKTISMSRSGSRPGEPDHLARQVDDPHGVAHVEHEDLAALAHGAGLNDEPHRFGDGHEEARHALVGHRHRPAGGDLPLEQRHDAAARAEHVAEAHGHQPVSAASRAMVSTMRSVRAPSRGPSPSRARRPCRCEMNTRPAGAEAHRVLDHRQGREAVVVEGFGRVVLHHRARACRRRRGRRSRGGALEHRAQLGLVADVDEAGREIGEVAFGLELVLDLKEVALGVVDQARSRRGPMVASCRQSSPPIEPPAPVTMTTSPAM